MHGSQMTYCCHIICWHVSFVSPTCSLCLKDIGKKGGSLSDLIQQTELKMKATYSEVVQLVAYMLVVYMPLFKKRCVCIFVRSFNYNFSLCAFIPYLLCSKLSIVLDYWSAHEELLNRGDRHQNRSFNAAWCILICIRIWRVLGKQNEEKLAGPGRIW